MSVTRMRLADDDAALTEELQMPEKWRPVIGAKDYEVSSSGRVRSLINGHIKAPTLGRNGFLLLNLRIDGRWTVRAVHSVVAETFIGPRTSAHMVIHKNGDRTDCSAENLAYESLSRREPLREVDKGKYLVGKLAKEQASEIRERANAGERIGQLAEEYGVSSALVSHIKNERKWKGA